MGSQTADQAQWNASVDFDNLFSTAEGRRVLSCIQCGTCAGACPYGDVMEYPPRRIIAMLRAGQLQKVFESDSLLACVACYSCMVKCPRDIQLTDTILPLAKAQVLIHQPDLPSELQRALQNTLRYGNPMGESSRKRAQWVKSAAAPVRIFAEDPSPAEVLWFVECYASYHPRGIDCSKATARLLHALGVNFAILGNEEKCAGECGRLTWEPGLYETLMDYNMAVLRRYTFRRVVTSCPHALNAFKYRYAAIGFHWEASHTAPFLATKLDALRPRLTRKLGMKVTYHDSCCLGRQNEFFAPPRALLSAIAGVKLIEMTHHHANSMCCGGGGGGMWLDTYFKSKGYERLSERRIREALATGADCLAVSCPYEVSRFEDALKVVGGDGRMVVRDVAELLSEAMEE
jgi:Fe-S oxidoreductase